MPLSRRQKLAGYEKELQEIVGQVASLEEQIGASSVPDVTASLIEKRREWTDRQAILKPVIEALRVEIAAKDQETAETNARIWAEVEKPRATAEIQAAVKECAEVFRPLLNAHAALAAIEEKWKRQWIARGRPGKPAKTHAGGDVFELLRVTPPARRFRRLASLFWKSVGFIPTGREQALARFELLKLQRAGGSIDKEELPAELLEEAAESDDQQTGEPQEISE